MSLKSKIITLNKKNLQLYNFVTCIATHLSDLFILKIPINFCNFRSNYSIGIFSERD